MKLVLFLCKFCTARHLIGTLYLAAGVPELCLLILLRGPPHQNYTGISGLPILSTRRDS